MQRPDIKSINSPCVIALNLRLADGSTLKIDEIVRVVPYKRLVCKAVWNDENVYAKLFIGANAERYAARDKKGVQALVQANIATPPLLYAGDIQAADFESSQESPSSVLIFSAITQSQNAEVLYHELLESPQQIKPDQQKARLGLLIQLTTIIARFHNANLAQTDLYFKNFLVDSKTIYAIDGDGIKPFSVFFKKRQKRHNLALLFSKLDGLDSAWIEDCYTHYCSLTGTKSDPLVYAEIVNLTQQLRQKAASDYANKKVFRTCSNVKVSQDFRRFLAISHDFDIASMTESDLDLALTDVQKRLKSGNTCTVGKALFANHQAVIKRYNIKNVWHGLKLSVSQSRAAKSWANAHRLILLNIATAKPLALLEERFGFFRCRAYFVTQLIDAPDIATFIAQCDDILIKEKVAFNTALLFYKLNILQISHGDCKASNIKIVDNKPVLIDLDSMQAHRYSGFGTDGFCDWWFTKKHLKDLKRFMQNWANDCETSAIFEQAFVQAYDEIDDYLMPTILQRAKIA